MQRQIIDPDFLIVLGMIVFFSFLITIWIDGIIQKVINSKWWKRHIIDDFPDYLPDECNDCDEGMDVCRYCQVWLDYEKAFVERRK